MNYIFKIIIFHAFPVFYVKFSHYLRIKKFRELLKQDGDLIRYLDEHDQTDELIYIALNTDLYSFKHIKKQTYELCKYVCERDGFCLRYVKNKYKTKELCKLAVKNYFAAIQYVPTERLTLKMVKIAFKYKKMDINFLNKKFHKLKIISTYKDNFKKYAYYEREKYFKKNISYYTF